MAYIGVSPNAGTVATQIITSANGSATSFTLDQTVPDGQSIIVLVGNVVQQPTHQGIAGAYTASGNTITFTGPPANGDNIIIRYLGRSVDVATNYKKVIRYRYIATNNQTTFTGADSNGLTLSYTVEDIDIFLNGVRLDQTDYTATNGTSVVLGSGATTSDELVVLAYNTVQLADTVPASTGGTFSGAVTINGAFTSQGIDDNADATAITIDSAENIGIGQAPETAYHSNWTAVDIGNRGGIAQYKTTGDLTLTYNLYHDGAWKAKETAPSGRYVIGQGPYHIWYTGASASADGAVTLTERMRISDPGKVGIGTNAPDTPLQVRNDTDTDYNISTATTNAVLNLKNNTSGASNCVGMSYSTEGNGEWYFTAVQESSTECAFHIGARAYGSRHDRMKINSDGTVLIGNKDSNPTAWGLRVFNVHATHATIEGWNDNSSGKNLNLFRYDDASIFQVSNGGAVWAAGGYSSDRAFKNIIGDCTEGWSKLKDVQPKSYRYKRISNVEQEDGTTKEVFSDDDMDSNIHYGVIAQDLKKILPNITYGEEGKMSVDYHGLLMVAINTIKELEARITALESK